MRLRGELSAAVTDRERVTAALREAVGRWLGESVHARHHYSSERRGMTHQAEILGLPAIPIDPIQDLDPESPTFGQFLFMMDYDSMV